MANQIKETARVNFDCSPELKARTVAKLPDGIDLSKALRFCMEAIARGTLVIPPVRIETPNGKKL